MNAQFASDLRGWTIADVVIARSWFDDSIAVTLAIEKWSSAEAQDRSIAMPRRGTVKCKVAFAQDTIGAVEFRKSLLDVVRSELVLWLLANDPLPPPSGFRLFAASKRGRRRAGLWST